ncbi:translocation/assembly module TamB domain-containing protein [Aurantivibrio plasticivorans]
MTAFSKLRVLFRFGRWLVLALLSLAIVLYFVLLGLFRSNSFASFVFSKVEQAIPEIQFSAVDGNLSEGLSFSFYYNTDSASVEGENATFTLTPSCLFRFALCVKSASIDTLNIHIYSDSDQTRSTRDLLLPHISIPVALEIDALYLNTFLLNDKKSPLYNMHRVSLTGQWEGERIRLYEMAGEDRFCRWGIAGSIFLKGNYPLDLAAECDDVQWQTHVAARLDGDLSQVSIDAVAEATRESLRKSFDIHLVQDALSLGANLSVALLAPNLPVSGEIFLAKPAGIKLPKDKLSLNAASISVGGNLQQLTSTLTATLDSGLLPDEHTFDGNFKLHEKTLEVSSFNWQWRDAVARVQGEIKWSERIRSEGLLQLNGLSLDPSTTPLIAPIKGVEINAIEGEGRWDISIDGAAIDADIALNNIKADYLGEPLRSSAHVLWQQNELILEAFAINIGSGNTLNAQGKLGEKALLFEGDVALSDLTLLSADLSGDLNGDWKISGPLAAWRLSSQLNSERLQWQEFYALQSTIQMDWQHRSERNNNVRLSIEEFRLPNGMGSQVQTSMRGTLEQQDVGLYLRGLDNHSDKTVNLDCRGGFNLDVLTEGYQRWIGLCDQMAIGFQLNGEKIWGLDAPIDIDWQFEDSKVSLSSFCLNEQSGMSNQDSEAAAIASVQRSKVCSNEYLRYVNGDIPDLNITGDHLPFAWIEPLLPESVSARGHWSFVLSGEQVISQQAIHGDILATDFTIDLNNASHAVHLPVETMRASAEISDLSPLVSWELITKSDGAVRGHLQLEKSNIEGELVVDSLQLKSLSPLLMKSSSDQLDGVLDASLTLTGPLDFPVLNGEVDINQGLVRSSIIPVPIESIQVNIAVNNNDARLKGEFESLNKPGEVLGAFKWEQNNWAAKLSLQAKNLEFTPEPRIELRVSPDITLEASPEEVYLTGDIFIPWARVEIRSLPEQAVKESADAIVEGSEKAMGQKVHSDLNVTLGDDVRFKGFGLDTGVAGALAIEQASNEPLRATGTIRLEKGRFKKYGQNLLIREGDLVFVNAIDNPQLRLVAVRDQVSNEVEVGLRATGPATEPNISLFSNPTMSQQEQISYLLTGGPPNESVDLDPTVAAAEAALSLALESELGSDLTHRASQLLGIEDIRVTTMSNESGPQVGVSGYLTSDLKVSYGIGVFEAVNSLTLNYRLTKNIFVEMTSGESSAFDVLWNFSID